MRESYKTLIIRLHEPYSLFHMEIPASIKKRSHQDRGLCYLHLPVFFLYIDSPFLQQNKELL